MKRTLRMSQKEVNRISLMDQVKSHQTTQKEVASTLGLSERQIRRIYKRDNQEGSEGLIHKNRGKRSNRKLKKHFIKKVESILSKHYSDFKPTFASEKLQENHDIKLSKETVRKIMIENNLWKPRLQSEGKVYQMRQRRSQFGELVQIDGSIHDWFEGRAAKCCLIVIIDDATSKLVELIFVPVESTQAYFEAFKVYIRQYGRPLCAYSDRHSIFKINTSSKGSSSPLESPGATQFARALKELDIELIIANTPQAKGRVERANQNLQDRLIKEMRLKGISCINDANAYLPEFIKSYNQKFSVAPRDSQNAHRGLLTSQNLDFILCKQNARKLSNQLTFQYNNLIFQIQTTRPKYTLRKQKVLVLDAPNEPVKVLYKDKLLDYTMITKDQQPALVKDSKALTYYLDAKKLTGSKKSSKPSEDHPWKHNLKGIFNKNKTTQFALKNGLSAISKALLVVIGGHF